MTDVIFDEAALREITEAAGMTPIELIDLFLEDAASSLAQLRVALAAGDHPQIGRIGHMMKSSAGNAGAVAVANAARQLETHCKTAFEPGGAQLCAALEAAHEAFVRLIDRERERLIQG